METLTLLKPHTDGDRRYLAGETITTDPQTAQWLLQHGVAQRPAETEPKTLKTPS